MQILNLKRNFETLSIKEDESVNKYSNKIFFIVNQIHLLGEDFPYSKIVEKVLVILPRGFESKISSLNVYKDLNNILIPELMSAR